MANMPAGCRPTIVNVLGRNPEPLPEWLADDNPPRFNRDNFFGSRTVYYPGCGKDVQPVRLCNRSHAAHTFIYVDHEVEQDALARRLRDPEAGGVRYEVVHQEELSEDDLRPGGWRLHATAGEAHRIDSSGWFVVLDRQQPWADDHGSERFATLFIRGDGYANYDALFCQDDGTPPPFLAVIQDHGFAGNPDRFGRDGLLECIARRQGVLPKYLLVGNPSREWLGFADTGATADPGGMYDNERRLFMRIDDNLEEVVFAFLHDSRDLQTRTTEDLYFIGDQINNLLRAIVDIVRSTEGRRLARDAKSLIRKLKFHEDKVNSILQKRRRS